MNVNDDEYEFRYKASIRFHGMGKYHNDIKSHIGTLPTHVHLKGESRGKRFWDNDIFVVISPIPNDRDFNDHINWIYSFFKPKILFLSELKRMSNEEIDIYLSYSTDCDTGGFQLNSKSIKALNDFALVGIPTNFSIMYF